MNEGKAIIEARLATVVASWLHALIILAAIALVPADPQLMTSENVNPVVMADLGFDEVTETITSLDGDPDLLVIASGDKVVLRHGERLCHAHEAPRASRCGEAFHARGPPARLT